MPTTMSSCSRACLRRSSSPARPSISRSCRNARRAFIAGSRFRRMEGGTATAAPSRRRACGCCRSADVTRFAVIAVLVAALVSPTGVFAHASLVRAEPADGAMLAETPKVLTLTFNEPVSVLVMRIVGPGGEVVTAPATAENNVVTVTPPRLGQGSHVLSWRVVSGDGHPVGGSLLLSVGAASEPGATASGNMVARSALWATKLAVYVGM